MWKSIKGYDNYYEINENGDVRSLRRFVADVNGVRRLIKGRNMKQSLNKNGYLVVNLRKNGSANVVPVHRLVATSFIENPNNLPTINHIDGVKTNNNVFNLEWATYSHNNVHALKSGLRKPRGFPIAQYDSNGKLIATYKSTCEASRSTGISRCGISHCVNGRSAHAGGFIWAKISESQTTIPNGSTQEDELPAEAQRPHIYVEDIVYAASNSGI